jgi:hypothetical protein
MTPVGFESTISAAEWQKTHTLDRAATGIGTYEYKDEVRKSYRNVQILTYV